jgi:hypothetical protein
MDYKKIIKRIKNLKKLIIVNNNIYYNNSINYYINKIKKSTT